MIVLDTHVWLWWAGGAGSLSRRAQAAVDRADRIGVCTISCWELAMLVRLGRVELDRSVDAWIAQALAAERVEPIPLAAEIAVQAGELDAGLPGDPVDRIVYATARAFRAPLVTKDRQLRGYDRELAVW